jgi:hypothetical protein
MPRTLARKAMKLQKRSWVLLTGVRIYLRVASVAQAQRRVVVTGGRWSPVQIAAFEQQRGPILDGV